MTYHPLNLAWQRNFGRYPQVVAGDNSPLLEHAALVGEIAAGTSVAVASTSHVITVTRAMISALNRAVLVFGGRENTATITSITDSRSNPWTVHVAGVGNASGNTFSGGGSMLPSSDATKLQVGDTITVNLSAAVGTGRVFWVVELSGVAAGIDKTATDADTAVGAGTTGTTATTSQADEIAIAFGCSDDVVGVFGFPADWDGFPTGGGIQNSGGAQARQAYGIYKILSGTQAAGAQLSGTPVSNAPALIMTFAVGPASTSLSDAGTVTFTISETAVETISDAGTRALQITTFPVGTTPVLDNFNAGANQVVSARTGWSTGHYLATDTDWKTDATPTSAQVLPTGGVRKSNMWAAQLAASEEAWATFGATPGNLLLFVRADSPTASPIQNMYASYCGWDGFAGLYRINATVNTNMVQVAANTTIPHPAAGDTYCLCALGQEIVLFRRASGATAFEPILYASDGSIPAGGYIGFGTDSFADPTITDFGGGTLVLPGTIVDSGTCNVGISQTATEAITDAATQTFVVSETDAETLVQATTNTLSISETAAEQLQEPATTVTFVVSETAVEAWPDVGTCTFAVAETATEALVDAATVTLVITETDTERDNDAGTVTLALSQTASETLSDAGSVSFVISETDVDTPLEAGVCTFSLSQSAAETISDAVTNTAVIVQTATQLYTEPVGALTMVIAPTAAESYVDAGGGVFIIAPSAAAEAPADAATVALSITQSESDQVITPVQPAYYGELMNANGLNNIEVGKLAGRRVVFRYRALATGTLDAVKGYVKVDGGAGGYSAGTGGSVKLDLQTDDGSGNPSGTSLGNVTLTTSSAGSGYVGTWTFGTGISITAGTVYHMVFTQADASPTVNWVSLNCIYVNNATPLQPTVADMDMAVMRTFQTADPTLINRDRIPIFDWVMHDGTHQGQAYFDALSGSGQKSINGANNAARQNFTPSQSVTVVKVWLWIYRQSGTTHDLIAHLKNSGGTDLATATITAASVPVGDPTITGAGGQDTSAAWVGAALSVPVSLAAGSQYFLELWSPSETVPYIVFPIQGGGSSTFGVALLAPVFSDGYLESTTNAGGTWSQHSGSSAFKLQAYLETDSGQSGTTNIIVTQTAAQTINEPVGALTAVIVPTAVEGPAEMSPLVTASIVPSGADTVADAGTCTFAVTETSAQERVGDAVTATLVIAPSAAETTRDAGSFSFAVTETDIDTGTDAGTVSFTISQTAVESLVLADAGTCSFTVAQSAAEKPQDAGTSLVGVIPSAGETTADAGSCVFALAQTPGEAPSDAGTVTFAIVETATEGLVIADAGTALIVVTETGALEAVVQATTNTLTLTPTAAEQIQDAVTCTFVVSQTETDNPIYTGLVTFGVDGTAVETIKSDPTIALCTFTVSPSHVYGWTDAGTVTFSLTQSYMSGDVGVATLTIAPGSVALERLIEAGTFVFAISERAATYAGIDISSGSPVSRDAGRRLRLRYATARLHQRQTQNAWRRDRSFR